MCSFAYVKIVIHILMDTFKLPELPYAYNALEPFFDKETMTIHHQRHHQGYVTNLNKALGEDAHGKDLEEILRSVTSYSNAVRNNAGGHYNHSLFWQTLSAKPQTVPAGNLAKAIQETFGSLTSLKEEINTAGLGQFGSGWAWLVVKFNGTLKVMATPNQDNPLMDSQLASQGFPILGIDVWEHAYYLKYQNKRADYLQAFWSVLDWGTVEKNYEDVFKKLK